MAFVRACEIPDHLWFHVEQDVWLKPEPDGTVLVGMTDPAQTRAGRILHVKVRTGKHVEPGKSLATVESGKWVGPVPSPLRVTVVEGNLAVAQDPNLINRDPYEAGWLARVRPDPDQEDWGRFGILQASAAQDAYRAKLDAEGLTCLRCEPLPDE